MIKHYVEFLFQGLMFDETEVREIKDRSDIRPIPKHCFGYRFFDVEVTKSESGKTLRSERFNYSGTHYFGKVFTVDDVRKKVPNNRILLCNMESNGYERVVKTRMGNFKPLEKNDLIIQTTKRRDCQ